METEFNHTIEIGNRQLEVLIKASGKVWTELYGADADGNRGLFMDFVDFIDFRALDRRGNDLTNKLEEKYPDVGESIQELIEEKLLELYNEGE